LPGESATTTHDLGLTPKHLLKCHPASPWRYI